MFLSVLPLTAQNTLANSCHSLQYTDGSEGVNNNWPEQHNGSQCTTGTVRALSLQWSPVLKSYCRLWKAGFYCRQWHMKEGSHKQRESTHQSMRLPWSLPRLKLEGQAKVRHTCAHVRLQQHILRLEVSVGYRWFCSLVKKKENWINEHAGHFLSEIYA